MTTFRESLARVASRRSFLAVSGLIATAMCRPALAQDAGTPSASGWAMTDGRGNTISLPTRPERVVAFSPVAAALWELGVRPVGVFGPFRQEDGSPDPQIGEVDLDAVVSIGDWEEFDLERLIALDPDLLVGLSLPDVPNTLWYVPEDASATVEAIVPTFGVTPSDRGHLGLIEDIESLAAALAADLDAPGIVATRNEFTAAEAELRDLLAEAEGLTALVISASPDEIYVANPSWFGDLRFFLAAGLPIIEPETEERWEILSWEQAAKYQADLILVDNRGGGVPFPVLDPIGTWQSLPAVQAGQVGPWHAVAPYGRRAFSNIVRELTEIIRQTDASVVA
ncbi:MAG: ABC transporter substrate-binding protein [Chloroflexia bacterium]|nr:ABC transporter substrate-binding protein [Chloroflexia bacterium]